MYSSLTKLLSMHTENTLELYILAVNIYLLSNFILYYMLAGQLMNLPASISGLKAIL